MKDFGDLTRIAAMELLLILCVATIAAILCLWAVGLYRWTRQQIRAYRVRKELWAAWHAPERPTHKSVNVLRQVK